MFGHCMSLYELLPPIINIWHDLVKYWNFDIKYFSNVYFFKKKIVCIALKKYQYIP